MTTLESFESLSGMTRSAVVDLLYRMADDAWIIGHRHAQWDGPLPVPDGAEALVAIAREEIAHARVWYTALHQLGQPDPKTICQTRTLRQYRCASLVSLPNGQDGVFCVVRQFLHDAAQMVRFTALSAGMLTPLATLAAELRQTESRHLIQGRRWVLALAGAGEEKADRLQRALRKAYPHALGLFEPTEADVPLVQAGICPHEDELRQQWESAVAPVLAGARLEAPDTAQPVYGGRVGQHHQMLGDLLSGGAACTC
jgi:ring-1,2-phenylacetyl-CoA epoxidase subunit PaaC